MERSRRQACSDLVDKAQEALRGAANVARVRELCAKAKAKLREGDAEKALR